MKSLSVDLSWISSNIIWENSFKAGSPCINCNNIPVVQNVILPLSLGNTLQIKNKQHNPTFSWINRRNKK